MFENRTVDLSRLLDVSLTYYEFVHRKERMILCSCLTDDILDSDYSEQSN